MNPQGWHETINRLQHRDKEQRISEHRQTFLLLSLSNLLSRASLSIEPHPPTLCFQAVHGSATPSPSCQGLMTVANASAPAGQWMRGRLERNGSLHDPQLLCFNSNLWTCVNVYEGRESIEMMTGINTKDTVREKEREQQREQK